MVPWIIYFTEFHECFIIQASAATFKVTSEIFMDISINKEPIGRLVFGMFGEEAPKTVENFREICVNGINGQSYAGSNIHRVIDKFIVQGEKVRKKNRVVFN